MLLVDLVPCDASQILPEVYGSLKINSPVGQRREKTLPDRLDEISRVVLVA